MFERTKGEPFIASQSSIGTYDDCQMKCFHRYVENTAQDEDYREPHALRFGKALHNLAEITDHDSFLLTDLLIEGQCIEHSLDWIVDGAKLDAMLKAYSMCRDHNENILAKELEIVTEDWLMYIDAVIENDEGWFMVDLKTAGQLDPLVKYKMMRNNQVCLYSAHHYQVAHKLNLDPSKFLGFEYREITKPMERLKKTEERQDYLERLTPKVRFTMLPYEEMFIQDTIDDMKVKLFNIRNMFIHRLPSRNCKSCFGFGGQTCPYFSQCYGVTATEATNAAS